MDEERITNDFVRNALKDQKVEQGHTQSNRGEFAAGSKVRAREHEIIMVKLLTNQKLKPESLNDVAMDQSVNQLRTTEDDPECVTDQENTGGGLRPLGGLTQELTPM